MRKKARLLRAGLGIAAPFLACALTGLALLPRGTPLVDQTKGFPLAKPVFAQASGMSFLEEEAGISAYVNVGHPINLNKAKTAYRTIERETSDYIIGSVALPDYPASEDVHCYVNRDGWIVVYYTKDEPTSKIIDWVNYSPGKISTKLDLALNVLGASLGIAITNVKYYHFNYPLANKLMLIAGKQFKITIPNELVVYESSFSFGYYEYGEEIRSEEQYGKLTPSQLRRGITHTVQVKEEEGFWESYRVFAIDGQGITSTAHSYKYGALSIVYSEGSG